MRFLFLNNRLRGQGARIQRPLIAYAEDYTHESHMTCAVEQIIEGICVRNLKEK
jgi:hypothetical protein